MHSNGSVWKTFAVSLTVLVIAAFVRYSWASRGSSSTSQNDQAYRPALNSGFPRIVTLNRHQSLQQALEAAQPGDTLILEAGATFVGPFTLPYKPGDAFITIQSSALQSLPGEGQRITPAQSSLMPRLVSPGRAEPVLRTAPAAHHYRFIGVEISTIAADSFVYELVTLGNYGSAQTALNQVPHHLIFDRCYIHAFPAQSLKRGVTLNSAETSILNCYIAGFKVVGQEAQAIMSWNGPGPFHIINNYLEAAGENIMFGGATATIPGLIPSDIEVRRNHLYKSPSWYAGHSTYAGTHWTVKNLFELKNARRVVVDGNLMENNWLDAQQGYAVVLTPRPNDSGPSAIVEDVQFTNNIVRHVAAGVFIQGQDSLYTVNPSMNVGRRITIRNNLFYDIDPARWGGDGAFLKIGGDAREVTVDHNTIDHRGNITKAFGDASPGFIFSNNIAAHNDYGIFGDSQSPGLATLNTYFPGFIFSRNVIAGNSPYVINHNTWYPADNFYPLSLDEVRFVNRRSADYRLDLTSPYRKVSLGGKEIGCDLSALGFAVGRPNAARPAATRPRTVRPSPKVSSPAPKRIQRKS